LTDDYGWSVAHKVAKSGYLPSNFNQWELTNNKGQTVAQIAYMSDHLPPNFDRWDLIKK
jgi:hypothetical protein